MLEREFLSRHCLLLSALLLTGSQEDNASLECNLPCSTFEKLGVMIGEVGALIRSGSVSARLVSSSSLKCLHPQD